MKHVFALLAACSLSLSAHAGCYSVYNAAGHLVHQSADAPVDTRLHYHDTVPRRFGPGATLVYVRDDQPCAELLLRAGLPAGMARGTGRPERADRG